MAWILVGLRTLRKLKQSKSPFSEHLERCRTLVHYIRWYDIHHKFNPHFPGILPIADLGKELREYMYEAWRQPFRLALQDNPGFYTDFKELQAKFDKKIYKAYPRCYPLSAKDVKIYGDLFSLAKNTKRTNAKL